VKFAGASPVKFEFQREDRNKLTDMLLFFRIQDLQFNAVPFTSSIITATLTGTMKDGSAITGTDSVRVVVNGESD